MCSACSPPGQQHSVECAVLQALQCGEEMSYLVVGVLRLLVVREEGAGEWEKIGR